MIEPVERFEHEEGWVAEIDLLADEKDGGRFVEGACEERQDQTTFL